MWFIVNTDKFQEQKTKEFLEETYPGIIRQVYLPKCRTKYQNTNGGERFRLKPLIYGMVFVKADNPQVLKKILSHWGYFVYESTVRDLETGEMRKSKLVSSAHLLCRDVKELNQEGIIKNATIPNEDMERFIYYSDKIADGIEGLSIIDKRYDDLAQVNDTIRIYSGPLAGWVGVVKQVKHKGKKDRHLLVRFGNNRCLNISNIRQYDMLVEHEATKGPKAEAMGAWRALDQMIGYWQAKNPSDNAYAALRNLFMDYQKKLTFPRSRNMSDSDYNSRKEEKIIEQQQKVLAQLDDTMRKNFRILSDYFQAGENALRQWLDELIPDAILRPFLTPTSGVIIPEEQDYAVLYHNGITELILHRIWQPDVQREHGRLTSTTDEHKHKGCRQNHAACCKSACVVGNGEGSCACAVGNLGACEREVVASCVVTEDEDTDKEEHIGETGHDKRLLRSVYSCMQRIIEANEEVRAYTHKLPEHIHLEDVGGEHQSEH